MTPATAQEFCRAWAVACVHRHHGEYRQASPWFVYAASLAVQSTDEEAALRLAWICHERALGEVSDLEAEDDPTPNARRGSCDAHLGASEDGYGHGV